MYTTNHALAEMEENRYTKYPLALPIALAAAGVGAILLSLYLANREVIKILDDSQFDVENYEVKDKPYIYGICE